MLEICNGGLLMANNLTSLKCPEEFKNLLNKLVANRVVLGIDKKVISNARAMSIIEKYFKIKNDSYLELVKTLEKKNV